MVTFESIQHNETVNALIKGGNEALGIMGYTEHGQAHAAMSARIAGGLLEQLGYGERTCELARIAGYLHDIGNAVNRTNHAHSGALLAFCVLKELDMPIEEIVTVMTAIGNHDEQTASAVTPVSAALILADKSDVRRSRVRTDPAMTAFDIHDRVNYAVVESKLEVQTDAQCVTLKIQIDTRICPVMDYFEIFLTRMILCRSAATMLGLQFELIINETRML